MSAGVLLVDPKFAFNVGAAIRACSIFGAGTLRWCGTRVDDPAGESGGRIPREERMREYRSVDFRILRSMSSSVDTTCGEVADAIHVDGGPALRTERIVPVAVELDPASESLPDFVHPEHAMYVFGPEDGSLSRGIKTACHRFVSIPSHSCLNLGACVNVVLYDRCAKLGFPPKTW